MTDADLILALERAPNPRPEQLVRAAARRLFPLWQAILVGVPIALIAASILGVALGLSIALAVGAVAGERPPWLEDVSTTALVVGGGIGVALVVRWLRRRRAAFSILARTGELLPTRILRTAGPIAAGLSRTLGEVYNWPIVGSELDGELVEVRTSRQTAFGPSGEIRAPRLMLVDRRAPYVALIQSRSIHPQRILRRTPTR